MVEKDDPKLFQTMSGTPAFKHESTQESLEIEAINPSTQESLETEAIIPSTKTPDATNCQRLDRRPFNKLNR